VAWSDVDGDGDLDLTAGNNGQASQIYRGCQLSQQGDGCSSAILPLAITSWATSANATTSIAWGDVDGDGDLDLAVGNTTGQRNQVYRNDNVSMATSAFFSSTERVGTTSLAWGDVDGDNDLDLAIGNDGSPNQLYRNQNGSLTLDATWSPIAQHTTSVAWGDFDGDNGLDLVVGNDGSPNQLYRNQNGSLTLDATWSPIAQHTTSVAWGDVDGDNGLDLAIGNDGSPNQLYRNQNGSLALDTTWSPIAQHTTSVAWGDVDGDGQLDLAVGNDGSLNQLYRNQNGSLTLDSTWSPIAQHTTSVAWGDVDGDGQLDLAVGNDDQPVQIYVNDGKGFANQAGWSAIQSDHTRSIAWGDMDGDGDLDLAIGNGFGTGNIIGTGNINRIYRNDSGMLTADAPWSSLEQDDTRSVAWADVDKDGDLDLAVGNTPLPVLQGDFIIGHQGGENRLYRNGSAGTTGLVANPPTIAVRRSGATPDAGFYSTPKIQDTRLITIPYTLADPEGDPVREVRAEYSLDGGGLWKSAIAASGTITRNLTTTGQAITLDGSAQSVQSTATALKVNTALTAEAWIFPTSNTGNQVILNREGEYELGRFSDGTIRWALANSNPGWNWQSTGFVAPLNQWTHIALTYSSIFIGSVRVYANGNLVDTYLGSGVIGDADTANNAFRIGFRQALSNTPFVGRIDDVRIWNVTRTQAQIQDAMHRLLTGSITGLRGAWRFDDARRSANAPYVWTMPDSSGNAANGTLLGYSAAAAPLADGAPTGAQHTFVWDTFASGVLGQSDNVVVRMEAYPSLSSGPNGTPVFQRPYASATTFPFRVRGTQVQVVDDTGALVPDAVVLRRPAGATTPATAFTFGSDAFATTDQRGFLRGRGTIGISDTLTVLAPVEIDATRPYSSSATLYQTNIDPATGLGDFVVSNSGVQTITVSPSRPLLLFHLDVSLEWDAHNDPVYLAQLESDLRRTSEILFDATNGQAALGDIFVFQDKEDWDTAHIRIHATSRLRPSALVGGVSGDVFTRTLTLNGTPRDLVSAPGQLQMGATWNRFGNVGDNLAEDWPRTLAHELGHYLFFLDDNYVGVDTQGRLTAVDSCPGLMADPYASVELRPAAGWLPDCAQTFSQQVSGRSDWQTIQDPALYDFLQVPSGGFGDPTQVGPLSLPLDVTGVAFAEPLTPTVRLDAPYLYARSAAGARIIPSPRASAYLIQDSWRDPETTERDRITALGGSTQDFVLARGARVGDRVCLFDPGATPEPLQGCTTIRPGGETITLSADPTWMPEITVTPVTSLTLELAVALPPSYTGPGVRALLHPTADSLDPIAVSLTRDPSASIYRGQVTVAVPLDTATIHVWTDVAESDPGRRDAVSSFSIGGSPGFFRQGGGFFRQGGGFFRQKGGFFRQGGGFFRQGGGFFRQGGGFFRQGGGFFRQGGGFFRQGGAPVSSASGDVLIYGENLDFDLGAYLVLQTSDSLPNLPSWVTPVGQSYLLSASANAPNLSGVEISFGYRGRDVPVGEEGGIRIYYQAPGASTWEKLPTTLNTYYNQAAAQLRGPGRYALMSSIEVPLSGPGWNLLAYPVQATRSPREALASADGAYTIVYGYEQADATEPWRVYAPAPAPAWVSDLAALEFGQGYWIYATRSTTVAFRGASALQSNAALNPPPATIYGVLTGATVGQPITAVIGTAICGQSTTRQVGAAVVFVIKVSAVASDLPACGAFGRSVAITLAGDAIANVGWDNTRAIDINARAALIYLPLLGR